MENQRSRGRADSKLIFIARKDAETQRGLKNCKNEETIF